MPSPPPGTRRASPPLATHVWMSMDGHAYGVQGGCEVHLNRQGRKKRAVNGGVLMNGNGQYLQHGDRRGEFMVITVV